MSRKSESLKCSTWLDGTIITRWAVTRWSNGMTGSSPRIALAPNRNKMRCQVGAPSCQGILVCHRAKVRSVAFGMDDESRDGRLRSLTAPSRPPSRNASRASQRTLRGSDVEMTELAPGEAAQGTAHRCTANYDQAMMLDTTLNYSER